MRFHSVLSLAFCEAEEPHVLHGRAILQAEVLKVIFFQHAIIGLSSLL